MTDVQPTPQPARDECNTCEGSGNDPRPRNSGGTVPCPDCLAHPGKAPS